MPTGKCCTKHIVVQLYSVFIYEYIDTTCKDIYIYLHLYIYVYIDMYIYIRLHTHKHILLNISIQKIQKDEGSNKYSKQKSARFEAGHWEVHTSLSRFLHFLAPSFLCFFVAPRIFLCGSPGCLFEHLILLRSYCHIHTHTHIHIHIPLHIHIHLHLHTFVHILAHAQVDWYLP